MDAVTALALLSAGFVLATGLLVAAVIVLIITLSGGVVWSVL